MRIVDKPSFVDNPISCSTWDISTLRDEQADPFEQRRLELATNNWLSKFGTVKFTIWGMALSFGVLIFQPKFAIFSFK